MLYRILLPFLAFAAAVPAEAAQTRRGGELPDEAATRQYLDAQIAKHVGEAAVAEARRMPNSIMALGAYGEFNTQVPAGLIVRQRGGWFSYSAARPPLPLPADVSAEVDRIVRHPDLWREPFDPRQLCTGGARIMTVRYEQRIRTTRQSCGPSGMIGRLAEIVVSGRVPSPPQPAELPPRPSRPGPYGDPQEASVQDPEVSREIWQRTAAAAAAWNRGELERFLEPYADDATLVWPTGVEYHKAALRARARAAQPWKGTAARRMDVRSSAIRQLGHSVAVQTYQIRFSGGGRPETQMWATSIWQKRRGSWEVTHEQSGVETPLGPR